MEPDLVTWQRAVDVRGADLPVDRLATLSESGVKSRLLSAEVGAGDDGEFWWITGGRRGLNIGLQHLVTELLGAEHRWFIQWLEGRWPRGPIVIGHPLDPRSGTLTMGIIAPLMPTRLAVSEGPLPLSIAAVSHFKEAHEVIGAPGLAGCRLCISDGEVASLRSRWPATVSDLSRIAAFWSLQEACDGWLLPAIEGLTQGAPTPPVVVVEATYEPEPTSLLSVEFGPVGVQRLCGLIGALFGDDERAQLETLASDLGQRGFFRVRLTLGPEGILSATALAGPPGQSLKGDW